MVIQKKVIPILIKSFCFEYFKINFHNKYNFNCVGIYLSFFLSSHLRKTYKFTRYVLQLAIADALFLLTIPFKVYEDIYQSWNLPDFICVAKEAVIHLNYNASVLFLVVSYKIIRN